MQNEVRTVDILFIWVFLGSVSIGVPCAYYIYVRHVSSKPWNLKIDKAFTPRITIIIPAYNESKIICLKLQNLCKIKYPKELVQYILIDDASTDDTLAQVSNFLALHPEMSVVVLKTEKRYGKSKSLNIALKHATGDIVIVSDVDCFWPPDILNKSLPYLADPKVGAISGPKLLLNSKQTWVTRTEAFYLNSMNQVKLGESKLGSTMLFEGGFSAYKRNVLEDFDHFETGSDDCGTILSIVQKARTLLVPEAVFFTTFPIAWKEKIYIKIRRATQLLRILTKYLYLLPKKNLFIPKKIILLNAFFYFVNPIIFGVLNLLTFFLILRYPVFLLILALVFLAPRINLYFFELIQNYYILFGALLAIAMNRNFLFWQQTKDRLFLTESLLNSKNLL